MGISSPEELAPLGGRTMPVRQLPAYVSQYGNGATEDNSVRILKTKKAT